MDNNSSQNQNISSPKEIIKNTDVPDKSLEKTSLIMLSPFPNSLQYSASNANQLSVNSFGDKIINNMSNEDINISEFQQQDLNLVSDIIVPSDENENEEEKEIKDTNFNKSPNNKNIIKTTISTITLDNNDKLKMEEIQKKMNENDEPKKETIIKNVVEGPITRKIITTTTTTVIKNGNKTITETKTIENNVNNNNNNLNNNIIKKEIILPTNVHRISKTETKENKKTEEIVDNNVIYKTEEK